MKVLVVGAAGKTGRAVVERAVARGHQVTAFVHRAGSYSVSGIEVRAGEAGDPAAMGAAVKGQDAVVDTVGGKTPYRRTTLEVDVATAIVAAMQLHGVRRLVVTSSVGVGDSTTLITLPVKVVVATFLRASTADKTAMEAAVRASGLDYIITRPAVLGDGPATGAVRVLAPGSRDRARALTRLDLADFLVAQLSSDEHLRQAVTIANA